MLCADVKLLRGAVLIGGWLAQRAPCAPQVPADGQPSGGGLSVCAGVLVGRCKQHLEVCSSLCWVCWLVLLAVRRYWIFSSSSSKVISSLFFSTEKLSVRCGKNRQKWLKWWLACQATICYFSLIRIYLFCPFKKQTLKHMLWSWRHFHAKCIWK